MKRFIVSSYSGNYEYAVKNNLDILLRDIKLENYNLLVIDSKISSNYPSIGKALEIKKISIDVNSESKSIEKLPYFLSLFIECDLRKGSKILVIGGATMQDIFGTICCLYYRGLEWGFVPTTVLAQGDSCVGSKTSLDGFGRKNQFGVFYPPKKIFICRDFLKTLPTKEIYSGIGDVIHYLLPYDENNELLSEILKLSIGKKISKLIDFSVLISSRAMKIKSELEIEKISTILEGEGKTIVNINLNSGDNILKFRLKNARKLDRKALNLLRNQEIQAIIN